MTYYLRTNSNKHSRIIFSGICPQTYKGKRRVGRQYTLWQDDIRKVAGPHWIYVARDKTKWKSLEEAFT
nr:uncharacterized protein LOC119630422 isoform X5 [Bombyx mori]